MSNLIVPVYLNQRIVFDLIAILEDGIATVTRLTSTDEASSQESGKLGGSFGLAEAFSSLLKISVDAERTEGNVSGTSATRTEDRIHTPTSLFHKLRGRLREREELITVGPDYRPYPGHIIEFTTSLHRNPLLQTLDALDSLMEMIHAFSEPEPSDRKKGSKQRQRQSGGDDQPTRSELKRIREQVSSFAGGVRSGETVDIVSSEIGNGFGAVVTLHQEYLNEPTMADLVDGRFTVTGKIIRVVEQDAGGINLLRKSALSAMSHKTLDTVFAAMEDVEGFDLPKLEMEVSGPVIQVIPIAVYT